MDPITIAAASLNLASGIGSWFASRAQADRMRAQLREQTRRAEKSAEQTLSLTRARAAASGDVEYTSGGIQTYLAEMSAELRRQIDWMKTTGEQAARDVQTAGTIGLFGDLGRSLFSYGQATNWGRTPPAAPASMAQPGPFSLSLGRSEVGKSQWRADPFALGPLSLGGGF